MAFRHPLLAGGRLLTGAAEEMDAQRAGKTQTHAFFIANVISYLSKTTETSLSGKVNVG